MALPTKTDMFIANIVAERILLKRRFEELQKNTKYFENIQISSVPWSMRLGREIRNFPQDFLTKYPNDFAVTYTTLGCNMLKCYMHNNNNNNDSFTTKLKPTKINGKYYANQPACYQVFKEFNKFLKLQFDLDIDVDREGRGGGGGGEGGGGGGWSLPVETLSIESTETGECFCGTQLSSLKRYAILPSSRWVEAINQDEEEEEEEEEEIEGKKKKNNGSNRAAVLLDPNLAGPYLIEKYTHEPLQRRKLSGIVDAPPLDWDRVDQTIRFNQQYCGRFAKLYNRNEDFCYKQLDRKVLGYIFGESVIDNTYTDRMELWRNIAQYTETGELALGNFPLKYVSEAIVGEQGLTHVNAGYTEIPVDVSEVKRETYTSIPDKKVPRVEKIDFSSLNRGKHYNSNNEAGSADDGRFARIHRDGVLEKLITSTVIDVAIETSVEDLPRIMAKLQNHYSSKFVKNITAFSQQSWSKVPVFIRLSSLYVRSYSMNIFLKISTRLLLSLSSAANVVFSVGLVTLVPDIILAVYNVGGFANELTRRNIEDRKRQLVQATLNQIVDSYRDLLPLIRDGSGNFVSPYITPEFIYALCMMNFMKIHPECQNVTGRMGIDEFELQKIAYEYLSDLSVNSVGQHIDYNNISTYKIRRGNYLEKVKRQNKKTPNEIEEDILEEKTKYTTASPSFSRSLLEKNYDLLFLQIGAACWLIAILLFLFLNVRLSLLIIVGTINFITWFAWIGNTIHKDGRPSEVK